MERLTQWIDDGEKRVAIPRMDLRNVGHEKCCIRLAEYEDLGLTPEEVRLMQTILSRWIPVTERLPEEHDSIFAKLKGTEKWKKGMFTKVSDNVSVTIKREDDEPEIYTTAKTIDGEWKNDFLRAFSSAKVIAWMPFPESYREEENENEIRGCD